MNIEKEEETVMGMDQSISRRTREGQALEYWNFRKAYVLSDAIHAHCRVKRGSFWESCKVSQKKALAILNDFRAQIAKFEIPAEPPKDAHPLSEERYRAWYRTHCALEDLREAEQLLAKFLREAQPGEYLSYGANW